MEEIFNPYREWLGWQESRAPDYYELLGIDRQQTDAGRIALAAEQAMTKVRSFRPGPRAAIWSRLLDEIRAAKDCLSDRALREKYDAALARSDVFPSAAGSLHAPPSAATLPPAAWAAGPSPIYDERHDEVTTPMGAIPAPRVAASASPYSGAVDQLPMAIPVQRAAPRSGSRFGDEAADDIGALLPPGSDDQVPSTATNAAAETASNESITLSSAPTAATFSAARNRKSRNALLVAVVGCIALVAVTAGVFVARPTSITAQLPTTPDNDPPSAPTSAEPSSSPPANRSPNRAVERATTTANTDPPPTRVLTASDSGRKSDTSAAAAPADSAAPMPRAPIAALSAEERRSRAEALVAALQAARSAVGEQDFSVADEQIGRAASLADTPAQRQAAARLKEVIGYVKQFRSALAIAAQGLQAAETFKTSSGSDVAFVESSADILVFHVAGTNRTYRLSELPPGLAIIIADRKLSARDPASLVVKGAYLATHPRSDTATREKAAALWQQAAAAGADVSHLTPFLTDDYAGFLAEAAR